MKTQLFPALFAALIVAVPTVGHAVTITHLVGDEDNFGFGSDPVPNDFFNNTGPGDALVFDRELDTSEDELDVWTHDFTASARFGPGFVAQSVLLEVREIFSDGIASTIDIDGMGATQFVVNGDSEAGPPIVQTFLFTGEDAAFANDGIVEITFFENGDNIAYDWSRLTVVGVPEPASGGLVLMTLASGVVASGRSRLHLG